MSFVARALSLPPAEAIDYLRAKTAVTSETYRDVWRDANARAFTVAGAATEALAADFHTEVLRAIEDGTTQRDFAGRFDELVAKHGWSHSGTRDFRARIIYETNLSTAYAAGRYRQMTEPETLAQYPYWEYVHSGAHHYRPEHKALSGLILRCDDPFWSTHYPPNGWGCGCWVRPLSARDLARRGKSGPDTAPVVEYRDWTNRKTGKVERVPVGIDPGWDYNVGQAYTGKAVTMPADATLAPRARSLGDVLDRARRLTGAARSAPAASPRVFSSPEEGDRILRAEYAEWAGGLSRDETYALLQYKGTAGFLMNEGLRTNDIAASLRALADDLETALRRGRLKEPLRVWRGEAPGSPNIGAQVGTEIASDAFASMTLDPAMAAEMAEADGIVLEIDLPAGHVGGYINGVPHPAAESEYEYLLPPGQRWRVAARSGNHLRLEPVDVE